MRKISVVIIVILLSITGCDYQIYEAKPLRENGVTKEAQAPINKYVTELVFTSETTTSLFAIDTDGKIHEFNKGDVRDAEIGMVARAALISEQNGEIIDISLNELEYLIYKPLIIEGTKDEVISLSAELMLKSYVGKSDISMAIQSFNIIGTNVIESPSENKFKMLMTYEVTPEKFAYLWGEPNEEGKVIELSHTYTLYGINNKWMFSRDIISEATINAGQRFLYEAADNQKVLYETDTYSYYEQYDYVTGEKENSEGTPSEYKSPIYRVTRSSGNTSRMYSGDDNYTYIPFYQEGKDLFVTTKYWKLNSESFAGYTGVLDVDRKYMTELINEPSSYGTMIGELAYIFTETKIKSINLKTKEVNLVADLPIRIDFSYGGAEVIYVDGNIIHLWISDGQVSASYTYNIETNELIAN